jgi:DNA uptake protein ComE-like DNA-binding protein
MNRRYLVPFVCAAMMIGCAETEQEAANTPDTAQAANAPAQPADQPREPGQMLDPNSANADEIAAIPGMNPTLATAIVQGRPHQDMRSVNRALSGLTETQRDTVYTRLWKPINLNTATREEIELIPGVGPRMSHEFEEYRPYTSIEQFRREIGKYVDQAEVARLERYVMVPNAQ